MGKCTACGSDHAYVGLNAIECPNKECENYVPQKECGCSDPTKKACSTGQGGCTGQCQGSCGTTEEDEHSEGVPFGPGCWPEADEWFASLVERAKELANNLLLGMYGVSYCGHYEYLGYDLREYVFVTDSGDRFRVGMTADEEKAMKLKSGFYRNHFIKGRLDRFVNDIHKKFSTGPRYGGGVDRG